MPSDGLGHALVGERVEKGVIGRAYGSLEGGLTRTSRVAPDKVGGNVEKIVGRHG